MRQDETNSTVGELDEFVKMFDGEQRGIYPAKMAMLAQIPGHTRQGV